MVCKNVVEYDAGTNMYTCKITGDDCLFILPDQKTCDDIFGADPEGESERDEGN